MANFSAKSVFSFFLGVFVNKYIIALESFVIPLFLMKLFPSVPTRSFIISASV